MRPAQRLLTRLESEWRRQWEAQQREAAIAAEVADLEREEAKKAARKAMKAGDRAAALRALQIDEDETGPASEPRIVVNDATVEKLGELLNQNPRGLVLIRDELAGWLANLDREGREGDRAFYLESWNGQGPFTYDRIGRGTTRIEAPALSIMGGIQPGKLDAYVRSAVRGGGGDDGLMQRFGLLAWPDLPASWRYSDRPLDPAAEARAWACVQRLAHLDPASIGAEVSDRCDTPFLRLDEDAQELFIGWQTELMVRLRGGGLSDAMESHLSKFPALAGRLALVLHLADNPRGPVSAESLARALGWLDYLEPHAARVYASVSGGGVAAAHRIVAKRDEIGDEFTARDIYRAGWAGLTDRETVSDALEVLVDHRHLAAREVLTGGRPSTVYSWRAAP